VPRLYLGG